MRLGKKALGVALCLAGGCTTLKGPGDLPIATLEEFGSDPSRDDTCSLYAGAELTGEAKAKCEELGPREYFHGVWEVDSDGGVFSFFGQPTCDDSIDKRNCLQLIGDALVYPPEEACLRAYEMEFVGRRYLHPIGDYHLHLPRYGAKVERVLTKIRLRNPAFYRGECKP